ncbi:MAG TPA: peptidoglycan-binding domain-containing protein, partial [Candidatus Acidoferrales bacterium]
AKFLTITLAVIFLAAATVQAAPQATTSGSTSTTHKSTSKKKKSSHHHTARREPFQKSPTPDRISEIQSALARGGYFEGDANGKWDANTVAAMQKFQSANGLNSSGKIDATTLQKLGLGSSTAGVDAPKPIKKSDSVATSSASTHPVTAANANSASNVTPAPTPATAASATKPQH